MSIKIKKLIALALAVCLLLTTVLALAETAKLESDYVQPTGTISGDLDAKGHFYSDYVSMEDALAAGNRLHLEMVREGLVLLKNEDGALPLAADERDVTFLGIASVDYVRAGGGSGSSKGTSYALDWFSGFSQAGFYVNPKTQQLYENLFAVLGGAHDANDSGKLLEPDLSYYSKSVTTTYAAHNDVAIVCISRFGRENVDLKTNTVDGHSNPNDHYLQLDDNELEIIKMAKANFGKVIVMINSSMIMQIPELQASTDTDYGVDAILWVGGIGDQGTLAAAEILTGEVNPSGHTADIWYSDFTKDPTFTNWSDMSQNVDENGNRMDSWLTYPDGSDSVFSAVEFREGIYYGYRYYETKADDMNAAEAGSGDAWYAENVLYPFGFGLSYTTFDWELAGVSDQVISAPNQTVKMQVKVTNTGDVAGKDVVELYATTPYYTGGIEKASAVLVGFGKTKLLQPGESDTVEIELIAQEMASFDWDDANGNGFEGYELEHGDYVLSARSNSHTVKLAETFTVAEDILCKTDLVTGAEIKPLFVDDFDTTREDLLENMISRATGLEQPKAQTAAELVMEDWEAAVLDAQETYYPYNDEEGQLWYVSKVPANWTQNAETTVTLAELAGNIYTEPTIVDGVATAATDEVSQMWDSYMNSLSWEDLTALTLGGEGGKDGPVQFGGTAWQSTPITSATWNKELVAEQGLLYGNQALLNGNYAWRGPGTNIHRSPFNGRAFEYYSEDPYLTAIMAAIVVDGVQSKGIAAFAKHFFANVQEYNRADFGGVCTFATEQVFREIYLRSFEYMVKYGHSTGMMTSFNRVGYVVNSNNWVVHEDLLRDEWGFRGATINDMWAKDFVSVDLMMRAGDDTLMGSDTNFKNYLTLGQWDAAARDGLGCVLVPTEDGDSTMVSTTHYYAVRKSAQRLQQSKVNGAEYKNFAADYELSATLYYGLASTAQIECDNTSDFTITVQDGQELPLGLSASGFVVSCVRPVLGTLEEGDEGYQAGWFADNNIYGDYPALGTYEVLVDMACDGFIKISDVPLTINIVSPIQVNGENVQGMDGANPVITLEAGKEAQLVFDSKPFAYQAMWSAGRMASQVTNWYVKDGAKYLRNEEKTHADGITIAIEDAQEKHEVNYTITGDIPTGMTVETLIGTAHGLRTNKPFEVVTGIQLSGAPAAGEYTITISENVPVCTALSGIWLLPGTEMTVEQTFTIIVK